MEIFDANRNLVSPEIEVPFMLKGLTTIFGKESIVGVLKKSFHIDKIEDFEKHPLLFLSLSQFYRNEVDYMAKLKKRKSVKPYSIAQHRKTVC
jgi:hypothetical protein